MFVKTVPIVFGAILWDRKPGREVRMTQRVRAPRFAVGDPVKIMGPGPDRGKTGEIARIIEPIAGDAVYRYSVQFSDGIGGNFFGFELEKQAPLDRAG
jgi:hypothetical protein